MTATKVKKSANNDSNGVEGTGDGIAGVAACDGADRLQAEQCSLTTRMSLVIRYIWLVIPWMILPGVRNGGFEGPCHGETGVRQHGHGTR